MKNKYPGKYRNETARATWWDYAGNGAYFITICTKNREHFLGEILAGEMHYTEIGRAAITEWIKTPKLRLHMDIELDAKDPNKPMNKFGPQSGNIASIFQGYKSAVATYARKNNIIFAWQPRFHDHIIRNNDEFQRIRNYILNNPKNWEKDSLR